METPRRLLAKMWTPPYGVLAVPHTRKDVSRYTHSRRSVPGDPAFQCSPVYFASTHCLTDCSATTANTPACADTSSDVSPTAVSGARGHVCSVCEVDAVPYLSWAAIRPRLPQRRRWRQTSLIERRRVPPFPLVVLPLQVRAVVHTAGQLLACFACRWPAYDHAVLATSTRRMRCGVDSAPVPQRRRCSPNAVPNHAHAFVLVRNPRCVGVLCRERGCQVNAARRHLRPRFSTAHVGVCLSPLRVALSPLPQLLPRPPHPRPPYLLLVVQRLTAQSLVTVTPSSSAGQTLVARSTRRRRLGPRRLLDQLPATASWQTSVHSPCTCTPRW